MTPRFSMRDVRPEVYIHDVYLQSILSIINAHLDYNVAHGLTISQAWRDACPELFV